LVNQPLLGAIRDDHYGARVMIDALNRELHGKLDRDLLVRIAWTCALAAAAVRKDQRLGRDEQNGLAESFQRRAVETLVEANRAGYFKPPLKRRLFQIDPILAPLRERPEVAASLNPAGS
jgi:hypothetical protein